LIQNQTIREKPMKLIVANAARTSTNQRCFVDRTGFQRPSFRIEQVSSFTPGE